MPVWAWALVWGSLLKTSDDWAEDLWAQIALLLHSRGRKPLDESDERLIKGYLRNGLREYDKQRFKMGSPEPEGP